MLQACVMEWGQESPYRIGGDRWSGLLLSRQKSSHPETNANVWYQKPEFAKWTTDRPPQAHAPQVDPAMSFTNAER